MPDDNTPPHVISLALGVARIEGKLDTMLLAFQEIKKEVDDHESRIKSVEKKWNIVTGFVVLGTAIGAVVSYLYDWLHLITPSGKG